MVNETEISTHTVLKINALKPWYGANKQQEQKPDQSSEKAAGSQEHCF